MLRRLAALLAAPLLLVSCADLTGLQIALDPDPARLDVDLSVVVLETVGVTEDEGLEYAYEWSVDGVVQEDLTSATVPWARTSPDEVWDVLVVPWDGNRWGPGARAEATMPSSPDHDGDGFEGIAGDGADCDDTDANVHPDAGEAPSNEVDDDCDGGVDEPTFTWVQSMILSFECSCHANANGPALLNNLGDYDAAYDELVDVPAHQAPALDRIEPGDPDGSYVWRKIEGTHLEVGGHGDAMPPVPQPPLDEDVAEALRQWILAGAPKD